MWFTVYVAVAAVMNVHIGVAPGGRGWGGGAMAPPLL
jgi:hypothetical protein